MVRIVCSIFMHSRALRIVVLLFLALWLNVIVPGHQRGIVSVPGWPCAACDALQAPVANATCCSLYRAGHASEPAGHVPAHGDPARHCAICYFAAHLSLPPAVELGLGRLFSSETAEAPAGESIAGRTFLATYDGRGPPVGFLHCI